MKFYIQTISHSLVVSDNKCRRTTDWRSAGGALLGIQVTKAVEAVGKVITRCKALTRELLLAAGAQEAILVPRLVMVGHSSSGDRLERT